MLAVTYWISPSAWGSWGPSVNYEAQTTLFFRVVDDGVNFILQVSADDARYTTIATLGRTAWLANPSHVGFGFANFAAEPCGSALAAFHHHLETP